jgi:hypothetical protein
MRLGKERPMEFTTALFFIGLITIILLMIEVNFTYATQG